MTYLLHNLKCNTGATGVTEGLYTQLQNCIKGLTEQTCPHCRQQVAALELVHVQPPGLPKPHPLQQTTCRLSVSAVAGIVKWLLHKVALPFKVFPLIIGWFGHQQWNQGRSLFTFITMIKSLIILMRTQRQTTSTPCGSALRTTSPLQESPTPNARGHVGG